MYAYQLSQMDRFYVQHKAVKTPLKVINMEFSKQRNVLDRFSKNKTDKTVSP